MNFDDISFPIWFPSINSSKYQETTKECWLLSLSLVSVEFIKKIDTALGEIESYLKKSHRGSFSFDNIATDHTLRCLIISVKGENSRQTFWAFREEEETKTFNIFSKPLKKKKGVSLRITYDIILKDYGLIYNELKANEQKYILYELFKRCKYSSKSLIEINPIEESSYYRVLIGKEYKYPVTLSAICTNNKIIGIKVVIYNPNTISDKGILIIYDKQN